MRFGFWEWLRAEWTFWKSTTRDLAIAYQYGGKRTLPCRHCLREHRERYFNDLYKLGELVALFPLSKLGAGENPDVLEKL